jgi:glycosyltransferase involved in cell wall biosynthesis
MPKSDKPLVSIITPSFNQGEFIEETIKSVIHQDYPNIEYIIIDGQSTDNTINIINKYNNYIKYWESEKDEGQTDAIIKGFKIASGKYITWLCSDDVLEPSAISYSIKYLENHPDVVMTYGDRLRIDRKGNTIGYHRYCEYRPWLLKWGFAFPQETSMIRRSAYDLTEGLDKSLKMAMDFDLFCKLNKVNGGFSHLPAFLGKFRSHESNKSTLFNVEISKSGFKEGAPLELVNVYKKHFKKNFQIYKWKYVTLINELLAFFDRRRKAYKIKREELLQ